MRNTLIVSSPSHLHAGNIDLNGSMGRLYGTLGFALEKPRFTIKVKAIKNKSIEESTDKEILSYLNLYRDYMGCNKEFFIEIISDIPKHVGLGRTTAMSLSIGFALNILCKTHLDVTELAEIANRGNRNSALGLYSFKYGGFIVDGGVKSNKVAPIIFRGLIDEKYKLLIAIPEKPIKDIVRLKEKEEAILSSMPKMDDNFAAYLSRLVLMKILPSFAEGDFYTFGKGLTEFNSSLGKYWSKYQGGIYCCDETSKIIEEMKKLNSLCACQSSWGPTAYGIFLYKDIEKAYHRIEEILRHIGGGRAWISKVDNNGAYARFV